MSDTDLGALRDDISFLKRLSTDALARPAPALWLMVVFGGCFGSSLLFGYAMALAGWLGWIDRLAALRIGAVPFYVSVLVFMVALAVAGWATLRRRSGAPKVSRAAGAAWTAALLGLVVVAVSFRIFALSPRHEPYSPGYAEHLFPAIILALWGAAWWVAGFTGERRWTRLIGPASFAAALAAAWFANTGHIVLVAGLSLLLLMAAPAVALLREPARA